MQREDHEAYALSMMVHYDLRPWWRFYFERFEHRSPHRHENVTRWRQGATPGWPDVGLFIPKVEPVCAVCELKTPQDRPRRKVAERWWLQPCDAQSQYGLREEQRSKLLRLHRCGWHTYVAYDAHEAYRWLDGVAGERP